MTSFSGELDRLISEWRALGWDVAEMVADLRCAADGLDAEGSDDES